MAMATQAIDITVGDITTSALAGNSTSPRIHDPSPKPSPDTTRRVAAVPAMVAHSNPDEYAWVEATPEVITKPAVLPAVSSSPTKAQQVLDVLHCASPDYIAMAPVTCSIEWSNQVIATSSLVSSITPTVRPGHGIHLVYEGQELLLPPLGMGIEQPPWPPPYSSADCRER